MREDIKQVSRKRLFQAEGNSKCKGSEVGVWLVSTRNNEEAGAAGPEQEGEES